MVPRLKKNTVIYSVLDSTEEINKLHGGIWEQIDVKVLAGNPCTIIKDKRLNYQTRR